MLLNSEFIKVENEKCILLLNNNRVVSLTIITNITNIVIHIKWLPRFIKKSFTIFRQDDKITYNATMIYM